MSYLTIAMTMADDWQRAGHLTTTRAVAVTLAAEVDRLRGELLKANADTERLEAERCDPRRATLPGPRIHPTHMKGWEAFGCDNDDAPLVRPLGCWTGMPGKEFKWKPGTEPWGAGETLRGASTIEILTNADSQGAYIYVDGTTEKGVTDAWHRARSVFLARQSELWL